MPLARAASVLLPVLVLAAGAVGQDCPGSWNAMGSGMNSTVMALTVMPNGDLIAGGFFTTAGGVTANRVARWDGTSWSGLGTGMTSGGTYVRDFAMSASGDLIAGGLFDTAGGATAHSVARWDGAAWNPLGNGCNNPVHAVAMLSGNDVAAGGSFTILDGQGHPTCFSVGAWVGGTWVGLGQGVESTVMAMTHMPDGSVIFGGVFTGAGGGISANQVPGTSHIARWSQAGWSALGTGMNSDVLALTVLPNGDLVAGGSFTSAGGVSCIGVARWDGAAWNPLGSGLSGTIYALAAAPNGDVIAGGDFGVGSGLRVARYSAASSTWSSLGTGMNATVRAVAVLQNGDVVAGGDFSTAGGVVASVIARWSQPAAPVITTQPAGASECSGGSAPFSVTATGSLTLSYQWQIETSPGVWTGLGNDPGPLPCGGSAFATPANAASVRVGVQACAGSSRFAVRCIVSNSCGSAISDPAALVINSADFNGDGDVGTDSDIEAFFACLAGSCCPTCGSADFNGDGDTGTDADIESFFRVLAGGAC